ncbi:MULTISPECIES: hypothetical protein [Bacillaceae]|jgi:hypothetical protein|uniref:hypothetical protein n=1 Tax=Bacillaceae TaxID=186817 RepID=UPI000A2AA92F|nr:MULTISPECIES: hypothetical protein [unclassified Bacillus (in: firmicutes)]PGY16003.1 hypothetical protein COE25_01655 [Bacillus sp. AFS031507]SMQ64712.1 hypothetical protein SAMN05444673_1078 [Bacillus sp. OV166]
MSFDNSKLGLPYFSLEAAAVDKSPSEMVITDQTGENYYIVTRDVFEDGLQQNGYKVVVNEGE